MNEKSEDRNKRGAVMLLAAYTVAFSDVIQQTLILFFPVFTVLSILFLTCSKLCLRFSDSFMISTERSLMRSSCSVCNGDSHVMMTMMMMMIDFYVFLLISSTGSGCVSSVNYLKLLNKRVITNASLLLCRPVFLVGRSH